MTRGHPDPEVILREKLSDLEEFAMRIEAYLDA